MNTKAVVVRVIDSGVAYVNVNRTDYVAGFSFGKIQGYRGESAKELGLRPGLEVSIDCDDYGKVTSVYMPRQRQV